MIPFNKPFLIEKYPIFTGLNKHSNIPPALSMKASFLYPGLIFLIGCLQYANTLGHAYAWDDKLVITANPYTGKGIQGIPDIFTKRVGVPNKNVYRPVTQSLFALEYDVFRHNPLAGHLFNILWYALTCLLVFYFIRFVFPSLHWLFAFFAALIFTVHPLHVEVVANIKSRDEILAMCFGLSGIIYWVKGIESGSWKQLTGGVFLFILALLSKENAVTLLPVAPLVWWLRGLNGRKRMAWTFLFPALSAAFLYWFSQSADAIPKDTAMMDSTVLSNIFLWTTDAAKVFPTALVNIGRYLLLFIFPHPLVHLYGYNQIGMKGWGDPGTWAMVALLAIGAFFLWKNRIQQRPAVFGLLFFGLTYSIYSNFFVLAPDTMADRYMFMPSLGLSLILMEVFWYLGGLSLENPVFKNLRSQSVAAALVLLPLLYFGRSWIGNRDWKNDTTLIKNRIQYMENNAAAQATLGMMLYRESIGGALSEAQRSVLKQQSMNAYMRAVDIYPDFGWAWISAGKLFAEQKIYEKAELAFLKAQQLEPLNPENNYCLGALYYTLSQGDMAVPYLEKAILLDPQMEQAYIMLGYAYILNNDNSNLGALAESAQKRFPGNGEFEALQAAYYWRTGKTNDAYRMAKTALQKTPQNPLALSIISSLNQDN
jgi:hypothetical protein